MLIFLQFTRYSWGKFGYRDLICVKKITFFNSALQSESAICWKLASEVDIKRLEFLGSFLKVGRQIDIFRLTGEKIDRQICCRLKTFQLEHWNILILCMDPYMEVIYHATIAAKYIINDWFRQFIDFCAQTL